MQSWCNFEQRICFFPVFTLHAQGRVPPIAGGAYRADLVKKEIARHSLPCRYEMLCPKRGTKGRKRGVLKKSL